MHPQSFRSPRADGVGLHGVQSLETELKVGRFYHYIVNSILVGPKHHYFIQQLPPIDQYYNPQPRQSPCCTLLSRVSTQTSAEPTLGRRTDFLTKNTNK